MYILRFQRAVEVVVVNQEFPVDVLLGAINIIRPTWRRGQKVMPTVFSFTNTVGAKGRIPQAFQIEPPEFIVAVEVVLFIKVIHEFRAFDINRLQVVNGVVPSVVLQNYHAQSIIRIKNRILCFY